MMNRKIISVMIGFAAVLPPSAANARSIADIRHASQFKISASISGISAITDIRYAARLKRQRNHLDLGRIVHSPRTTNTGDIHRLISTIAANTEVESAAQGYIKAAERVRNRYIQKLNVAKGDFVENFTDLFYKQGGWKKTNNMVGVNGIDGLYYKLHKTGNVEDVIVAECKFGSSRLGTTVDGNMQLSKGWVTNKIRKRIDHLEEMGELTAKASEDLKIHKQILRQIEGGGSIRYRLVHGDIVDGNMVLKQFDASPIGAKAMAIDKIRPTSQTKIPLADADNAALNKFQREMKEEFFKRIETATPDKQLSRKLVEDLKAGQIRNTSKLNKAHRELLEGIFDTSKPLPKGMMRRGIDATKGRIRRIASLAQDTRIYKGGRRVVRYIAATKGGKYTLRIAGKGGKIIAEGGKIVFIAADFAFIAWETKHDIEQYLAGNYNDTMVVVKSTMRTAELACAIAMFVPGGQVIGIVGGIIIVAIDIGSDYYNEARLARQKELLDKITVDQRFRATSEKLKARINAIPIIISFTANRSVRTFASTCAPGDNIERTALGNISQTD